MSDPTEHDEHRIREAGSARPAENAPARLAVELFAGLAEAAGTRRLEVDWPGGTVADLRRLLARSRPALAPLLATSAVAVADRYAADETAVAVGDAVAVLPPVSGG